jgi:hypothetical protein
MTGDGDDTGLVRVFEVPMTTPCAYQMPTVGLHQTRRLSDFHETELTQPSAQAFLGLQMSDNVAALERPLTALNPFQKVCIARRFFASLAVRLARRGTPVPSRVHQLSGRK